MTATDVNYVIEGLVLEQSAAVMLLTNHGELSVHQILHTANHDQKKSLSKAQRESRN